MIARWMIAGFALWLAVTVVFRFVGERVFNVGDGGVSWAFMILPVVMFVLTYALLKLLKVAASDRAEAASIFAMPGMLIGIYEINSFSAVFPNIDASLGSEFAALMFASYAAVIIAGIVTSHLRSI